MCWRGVGLTQNLFAVESFITNWPIWLALILDAYRRKLLASHPDYVQV